MVATQRERSRRGRGRRLFTLLVVLGLLLICHVAPRAAGAQGISGDLIVSLNAPAASVTPAAGSTILVEATTNNISLNPAAASTTKIYLSTRSTFDAGVILVGSQAIPPLPGRTERLDLIQVQLPAGHVGVRYLFAVADADNTVTEGNESNNVSTQTVAITIGADLVVSLDVPGSVTQAAAGDPVTVTDWTGSNNSAPVGASTTKFYLIRGTILDGNAVLLGSRAVPPLSPSERDGGSAGRQTTLILPATAGGTFRIIAKADADDAVLEINENNNVSAPSTEFKLGPDLVAFLDVPAGSRFPGLGATVSVAATAQNLGLTPAPASTVHLYYSALATFDASAVVVGSWAVPALGPKGPTGSAAGTISFTLPPGDVGPRYLYLRSDADGVIEEANENNNLSAPGTITVGGDLKIVSLDVPGSVTSAAAGDQVTVTDFTRSANAAPVGASTTKFYLIRGTALDQNAVLLGSREVPALPPSTTDGGSAGRQTTLTLPANVAGTFRIVAKADADNSVPETNEDNNVSNTSAAFTLGPDLVVFLDVPGGATFPGAGATIAVDVVAQNLGRTPAPSSTARLYYSAVATFDASAAMVGSWTVPALGPKGSNDTVQGQISFTLPAGEVGPRYLYAKADADGVVPETNEDNNVSLPKTITTGGDLVIFALDLSGKAANAAAGDTVEVTDTTKNVGAAPVGASTTKLYLVTGTAIDASSVLLGSRSVPGRAPGQTSTGKTSITLPPDAVGTFRVMAKADADNAVPELNEDNNTGVPSFAFTLGPDLRVTLSLPGEYAAVAAGTTVRLTDFTKNDAGTPVAASTTRFYLSTDATVDASDVVLGSRSVPALPAGQTSTALTEVALPDGIAGTYRVIAVADAENAHAELSETNNAAVSRTFTIGPDLTVLGLTAPAKAPAGATVLVHDETKNVGGGQAPPSRTGYYLSRDAMLDPEDVFLGSRAIPQLEAFARSPDTTTVTIPHGTAPGCYFLIAAADAEDTVLEVDENNNSFAHRIQVSSASGVTFACARGDFDGDGKSDILWRHSSGHVGVWLMDGITQLNASIPASPGPEWRIDGLGDFNGDGKADILWRETTGGAVGVWLMNGATLTNGSVVASPPLEWSIAGVGDFNGDGKSDILWRETTGGAVGIWLMDGTSMVEGIIAGGLPLDWAIERVGDFDGDGKADILWRQTSTGAVAVGLGGTANMIGGVVVGNPAPEWAIERIGDFNGDGKADILLQEATSGAVEVWLMDGANVDTVINVVAPGGFSIHGVGDFDGDGRADILWRDDAGMLTMWLMDGMGMRTSASWTGIGHDWTVE